MKKMNLVFGALVAAAAMTAPAQGQVTIVGTTTGCFYKQGINSNACLLGDSYEGLTFTGGSFSVDATPGVDFQLNTLSDYLGMFSLSENSTGNFGGKLRFRLTVMFSSPTSATPNPYTAQADFKGDETIASSTSDLDLEFFSPVSFAQIDYTGGINRYFRIKTFDVSNISRGESMMLTGMIGCTDDGYNICEQDGAPIVAPSSVNVPEPSSVILMTSGLMGIFGFARRRNRRA